MGSVQQLKTSMFVLLCLSFLILALSSSCVVDPVNPTGQVGCLPCEKILQKLLIAGIHGGFRVLDDKKPGSNEWMSKVQKYETPFIKFAIKMFISQDIPIKQDFQNQFEKYIRTPIIKANASKREDFNRVLRDWVSEELYVGSENELKADAFDDNDAKMALLSVYRFQGEWKYPWSSVSHGKFKVSNSKEIDVKYLTLKGNFEYFENEYDKAVKIPLMDRNVSLMIKMKNTDTSKTQSNPGTFYRGFVELPVLVKLPPFKLEYSSEGDCLDYVKKEFPRLSKTLNNSKVPNFEYITDAPLSVSKITQTSIFNVNERGIGLVSFTGPGSEFIIDNPPITPDLTFFKEFNSEGSNLNDNDNEASFIADHPFIFELEVDVHGSIMKNIFGGGVGEPIQS